MKRLLQWVNGQKNRWLIPHELYYAPGVDAVESISIAISFASVEGLSEADAEETYCESCSSCALK